MELTWGEMRNVEVPDHSTVTLLARHQVLMVKQFLTGTIGPNNAGVWTVVASSDGVTRADSDQWADVSDVVLGNSWVLLRSSGLGLDLVLYATGASVTQPLVVAGASSGTFSAGTYNTRPTSAVEFKKQNDNQTMYIVPGTPVPMKMHGLLSTRGDFWLIGSLVGQSRPAWAFGICKLSGTKAGDEAPWAMHFGGYANNSPTIYALSKNAVYPIVSGNGGAVSGTFACRAFNGAEVLNDYVYRMAGAIWPSVSCSGASFPTDSYVSQGPLDRTITAVSDGLSLTFPVYIAITATDIQDFKGTWPDALLGSVSVPINMPSPTVGQQQYLKVGTAVWLPFTGGTLEY